MVQVLFQSVGQLQHFIPTYYSAIAFMIGAHEKIIDERPDIMN